MRERKRESRERVRIINHHREDNESKMVPFQFASAKQSEERVKREERDRRTRLTKMYVEFLLLSFFNESERSIIMLVLISLRRFDACFSTGENWMSNAAHSFLLIKYVRAYEKQQKPFSTFSFILSSYLFVPRARANK